MSLDGTSNTFIPYTINGINPIAGSINTTNFVKYSGNTSNTDLNGFDLTTAGTISAQQFAIPDNNSNDESWITYTVSTMGNLSTVGGLITTDLTNGRSMYFTGGVLGAPNFQFATLGNEGKVICTNDYGVFSTTINAGQLDYITALTSQAGGVGQQNTWSDVQIHSANVSTTGSARFIQPYNAGVLEISTLVNRATLDSAISAIPNLLTLSNTWSGAYNQFNGTVSTMGSNRFIQSYNAVSADISTVVNRATLDSAIAGLGAGILTLNNTWSGTNTFENNVSTIANYTTDLNGVIQTRLNSLGYDAGSFSTAGVVGSYTPPLGTITGPVSGVYTITQTAQARSIMRIPAFGVGEVLKTYYFEFNIRCSIGTAILNVEQNNLLRSPQYYQLSTGFNIIRGSFYVDGTANSPVFKIYTGVASWTADWDSFTLSTYSANIVGVPLYAPKITTATSIAMTTAGGTLTMLSNGSTTHVSGDNSYAKYGPSASYPGYTLAVGATSDVGSASIGQLIINDGNVFLDASNGKSIYYGSYQTDRGGTGTHEFYGNRYLYGNDRVNGLLTVNNGNTGSYGVIQTDGTVSVGTYVNSTAGWYGTQSNHPLNFFTNNGVARLTIDTSGNLVMNIQKALYLYYISTTNNAGLITNASGDVSIFTGTGGVSNRMTIKNTGDATYTSGDGSYIRYGPNATWNSYLTVGATPDRSGASNAQVITTNGNLHLDGGNSADIYYGYYPFSRSLNNTHRFYGNIFLGTAPAYITGGCSALSYSNGSPGQITRSNVVQRLVWYANSSSWAGGVNATYAFYKATASEPVKLTGRFSHYVGGGGMSYPYIRIYSQSSGVYSYYSLQCYFNVSYNHTPQPIDLILQYQDIPYTGWFDVYFYNNGGCITDGNDFLWINATNLLATGY